VRLGNGTATHHTLTESHMVVGRSPKAQLTLDHTTVSRRHAELFFDPFGRWWVRDLASTNGTRVNGEIVVERILNPGDTIGIGDFTLRFFVPSTRSQSNASMPFGSRQTKSVPDYDSLTSIRVLSTTAESPKINASHLSTVMGLSRRLLSTEEPVARLNALCEVMVGKDFPADTAFVLRVNVGESPRTISGIYRRVPLTRPRPPYISQRVLQTITETREPVLASNLPPAGMSPASMELTMSGAVRALTVIACPIEFDGDQVDVFYVKLPPKYGTVEWLALVSLVAEAFQQAESTWAARRHAQAHAAVERELDMARTIQQNLVPTSLSVPGLDVAIGFEPSRWVGGDYVDCVPMPDGRVLLTIADVCGKGLQAALVTSSLHTMVHATIDTGRSLTSLLDGVNKYFCRYLPENSFVTLIAVAINPRTGEIECVNAGHPPPFLISPTGALRELQSEVNPALGMILLPMESQKSVLGPGEVLALYTDGLTELRNMNREMLGVDRLGAGIAKLCSSSYNPTSAQLAEGLTRLLDQYRGKQLPEDDRAFLFARRNLLILLQ
jgi:phosphoserine phosphatase RsbU/P